jgi:hypothetical protein
MRKRPKKGVVYEKYGHFFMVYEIFSDKTLQRLSGALSANSIDTTAAARRAIAPFHSSHTTSLIHHLSSYNHVVIVV